VQRYLDKMYWPGPQVEDSLCEGGESGLDGAVKYVFRIPVGKEIKNLCGRILKNKLKIITIALYAYTPAIDGKREGNEHWKRKHNVFSSCIHWLYVNYPE
jgi:hypothetical protein